MYMNYEYTSNASNMRLLLAESLLSPFLFAKFFKKFLKTLTLETFTHVLEHILCFLHFQFEKWWEKRGDLRSERRVLVQDFQLEGWASAVLPAARRWASENGKFKSPSLFSHIQMAKVTVLTNLWFRNGNNPSEMLHKTEKSLDKETEFMVELLKL